MYSKQSSDREKTHLLQNKSQTGLQHEKYRCETVEEFIILHNLGGITNIIGRKEWQHEQCLLSYCENNK
jgi:hypothetical protein